MAAYNNAAGEKELDKIMSFLFAVAKAKYFDLSETSFSFSVLENKNVVTLHFDTFSKYFRIG